MLKKTCTSTLLASACALVMTVSLVGCNNGPVNPDMSKVTFSNQEFTYDGTAKTLEIKNLPDVLNYTFDIKNGDKSVQASEVVNVGSYTFTATFSSENAKVVIPDPMKATLTIVKGTYDMSSFEFNGLEVAYDGEAHLPAVSGVPVGVTATLKVFDAAGAELANGVTNAGSYKVTATFAGNDNYKAISAKEAYMVVKPAAYDESGISVTGLAVTYDGKAHLPTVSGLPTGVKASFVVVKDGETTPVAGAIDAGTYHVTISFTGDNNHVAIADRTVDLVIGKATYDMSGVQITNLQHTYDGSLHTANVTGLPAGVSAALKYYPGNSTEGLDGATEVGNYRVVASFTGNANYNAIENKEAQLVIDKADYDMSKFAINDLEVVYDGNAHLPTVSGLPEGVTATIKLFSGETEVQSAKNAGSYKVVVSFAGAATHNAIANREATLKIAKADYDMSNVTFGDLDFDYDGAAHTTTVTGLPEGVTASIKLYVPGSQDALESVTKTGIYDVVASFTGDANHNAIPDMEDELFISHLTKELNVKVYSRTFNVNENAARKVDIVGNLQGLEPKFTYVDSNGDLVEDINDAPVGEYDVYIVFSDDIYLATNLLESKLTITDKVVKNISTYAELQAMAKEAQDNFTLYEADGVNELTGEVENWSEYNGGNPADRWANKVTYQLVTDINCRNQVWKAAGWDVGHYLLTEEAVVGGEDVRVIKGTDYVVNVPRADGPADYGFGYLSLFLDGNGHSIQNMVLANDTHENTVSPTNELGYYPSWCQDMGSDYRRTGMFVSTAFSTFKDIVFDNPTMGINDTTGTVTWAGFINATESQGNTYQGLTFNHPVINANVKKANIGGIAGITLVLARDIGASGVRGADFYLDRPEEMVVNFKDVEMNNMDFKVNTPSGRNSVGGLYGENQGGWLTFNLDNVNLKGEITLTSGGTNNNAADFFGFIEGKYMAKGNFTKDPDPFYTFNINNCYTDIDYYLPASHKLGLNIQGVSYRRVEVSEQEYVANKYYHIVQGTYSLALCDGAYDADEYYYERVFEEVTLTQDTYVASKYYTRDAEGRYTLATGEFDANANYFESVNETLDTTYVYIVMDAAMTSILNSKITITNSESHSGLVA